MDVLQRELLERLRVEVAFQMIGTTVSDDLSFLCK